MKKISVIDILTFDLSTETDWEKIANIIHRSINLAEGKKVPRRGSFGLEMAKKSLDNYAMHTYGWLASLPIGDFL